jgi:hypothetical protein
MGSTIPLTCNIAKKGLSSMQSLSPASSFLSGDSDAARNPFQAILLHVGGHSKDDQSNNGATENRIE